MNEWPTPHGDPVTVAAAAPDSWPLPVGLTVPVLIERFDRVARLEAGWADTIAAVDMGNVADTVNAATAAAVLLERLRRQTGHVDRYQHRLDRYRTHGVVPHRAVDAAGLAAETQRAAEQRVLLGEITNTVDTWIRFGRRTIDASRTRIRERLGTLAESQWFQGDQPIVARWWPLGGAVRTSDAALMEPVEWTQFVTVLMGRAIEYGRAEITNHPSVQEELAARRAAAPFRSTFAF